MPAAIPRTEQHAKNIGSAKYHSYYLFIIVVVVAKAAEPRQTDGRTDTGNLSGRMQVLDNGDDNTVANRMRQRTRTRHSCVNVLVHQTGRKKAKSSSGSIAKRFRVQERVSCFLAPAIKQSQVASCRISSRVSEACDVIPPSDSTQS